MADSKKDPDFPCSMVISTPFPTYRLAESALRALQVDEELSPMVRRSFTLVSPAAKAMAAAQQPPVNGVAATAPAVAPQVVSPPGGENKTVLRTVYRAKTNRMLRVAVNGFMESLGVVLGVMERLDVDVLSSKA